MPIASTSDHPKPVPAPVRLLPELECPQAGRLPIPLTPLVGRESEVATVIAWLREGSARLVTLIGPGGAGKTRLAIRITEELRHHYVDGYAFVSLSAVRDPDFAIPTIARSLGVWEGLGTPTTAALTLALQDRDFLLVLDNLEQITDSGPQLADLLTACPRLSLLVTSQSRLRLSMEHLFPVPPLSVPERGGARTLEQVANAPAVALFVQRAQQVRPDFALTSENAEVVIDICRRLEGLPLAIELAAARLTMLSLEALLERLDRRLRLLIDGSQDLPLRLQTMSNAIAWSYELLDPVEQELLRRLAVFLSGWTLEGAEAVTDVAVGPRVDTFQKLSSLIDKSLVHRLPESLGAAPRFAMYESIREYSLGQLSAGDREEETARDAHATYFLRFAEAADEGLLRPEPEHDVWRDRLSVERDNLRAALGWLTGRKKAEQSLRLSAALGHFWFLFSDFEEGIGWFQRILALPPCAAATPRALALRWAGLLALYRLDLQRARKYLEESLALFRSAMDGYGMALALTGLGLYELHQGNYDESRALHEEALDLVQALGDEFLGAAFLNTVCIHNLGVVAYGQGDLFGAAGHFEEAIYRATQLGHSSLALLPLVGLGHVVRDRGDHTRAVCLYSEALNRSRQRKNRRITAYALAGLASIGAANGQREQAARLFGAVEALLDLIGVPLLPAFRGSHERAVTFLREKLREDRFIAAWVEGRTMSLENAVAEGRTVVAHPPVSQSLPQPESVPLGWLTPREHEVLKLLVEGHTDREIAAILSVSPRTVGAHVTNLFTKLGVETRTAAAAYAFRNGLA